MDISEARAPVRIAWQRECGGGGPYCWGQAAAEAQQQSRGADRGWSQIAGHE